MTMTITMSMNMAIA